MGCASSSPLINGGGPGGIVGTAKETASKAANEVLHAGETAIHDVGEHVKEAVQNVTNEIGGVLGGKKAVNEVSNPLEQISKTDLPQTNGHGNDNPDYKIIPLKDPNKQIVDENLENIKNNILKKAQSFSDDTEQMADDIIKETEDLIRDAETVASDSVTEMTTRITSSEDGTIEILNLEGNHTKTPTHSIDSLITSSPEPEIERILDNEPKCPPTPEATMNSMVSSDVAEVFDSTPNDGERQSQDKKPEQGQDGSKREA
ncbi:uncharacterized protein LOC129768451 isoform X1 [Toxorhynchites rutilus septentrionalis]|uniref:uncharacterized protein LOC129768451 isoform X1 n=1 Tax=Toxorhynchites rutilus septentrionalis TaxID=329112 RepID=UPI0024785223|nr:uncharacterized protein LOC129768451 isoform X1 [Toxorhynchites rutilus septentrionalis]XP_055626092.1 uncharacterized protein LOC129768451 isoform X1 [Toxorhynchites rutilus septentrionalis]XP_055626093.1 uncharacterized protein LOC129768451 isoform X1 [Toxorhynchites rutilus septentrionalis]XP_055626094.1 uncharacterized protein LOC129768451 isoform X1 [Toxorhynchites rutilus septentrionalis]XP_055626095.1 uncharacterized protein LOC129768451 isoform X1 [Toxorhynchites rutilus septentriona